MTIKEQVIRESIQRCEKRIKEIDEELNADYVSQIFEVRKEFVDLVSKSRLQDLEEADLKHLKALSRKEKRAWKLYQKQNDTMSSLIQEKADVQLQLRQLHEELHFLNWRLQDSNLFKG